jgi:hypothetical protein
VIAILVVVLIIVAIIYSRPTDRLEDMPRYKQCLRETIIATERDMQRKLTYLERLSIESQFKLRMQFAIEEQKRMQDAIKASIAETSATVSASELADAIQCLKEANK